MSLAPGPDLGRLARDEFTRRLGRAQTARDKRTLSAADANALLAPWASLALRLAKDPAALVASPEFAPLMADYVGATPSSTAAIVLAEDLCSREGVVAAVAKARDAALAKAPDVVTDSERALAIRRLVTLAISIGCPPIRAEVFRSANRHQERIAA